MSKYNLPAYELDCDMYGLNLSGHGVYSIIIKDCDLKDHIDLNSIYGRDNIALNGGVSPGIQSYGIVLLFRIYLLLRI